MFGFVIAMSVVLGLMICVTLWYDVANGSRSQYVGLCDFSASPLCHSVMT